MEQRNLYLYWVGEEYTLITILRNLIYLHSTNGVGYKIHLINEKNIGDYVEDIPSYFSSLCPAHQADFVIVNVICKYGGIWMDSDTLVLNSLDSVFDHLDRNNGFFIHLWTFKMPILVFIIFVFSYLIFLNIIFLSIICSI